MSEPSPAGAAQPASEATKTALENSVTWFLSDKLGDAAVPIVTKKFLTNANELVYLTLCNVAETSVPRIKVQHFERVNRGVREVGYQLFGDHRFTKYTNDMIFGANGGSADGSQTVDVSEAEAAQVVAMVNGLTAARQTL
jgi:hypothetical protein